MQLELFVVSLSCLLPMAQGKVIKSYFSGKKESAFLKCISSRKGGFIYAVGEDRNLYCFNATTSNLDYTLAVSLTPRLYDLHLRAHVS